MDTKEIKREEIIGAARDLFADYGYKSVSMEQIAQKSHVAKGTIYLYFKDKEDLFLCLAEEFINQMNVFLSQVEQRGLSLADEVHEVVYNLLMFRKGQKFLYKIFKEAKDFKAPIPCKAVDMIDGVIHAYLERRLQAAIDKGAMKPCNTRILSFLIIKLYVALAFEWEEKHEPLKEREVADSVRMFLKESLMINQC